MSRFRFLEQIGVSDEVNPNEETEQKEKEPNGVTSGSRGVGASRAS